MGWSQSIEAVQFNHVSEFEYIWTYSCYSVKFDDLERPYLFTANNELGIVSFDISDIQTPTPVDTILPADFGGLKPTNLHQNGKLLYASLGGIQGLAPQDAGIAVMDVSDPENILILDYWSSPDYSEGGAIVLVEGNYAYVGAMEEGVLILDVSDPSDIQFVSRAYLDENFPQIPGLFSVPNARGMSIRSDTLIVANDAGGLRMVDVSDKNNPIELSKYMNWDLFDIAQPAYNNVLLVDDHAYVPVDYCGLDVVDVSDTAMSTVNWLNPWGCLGANWNGRAGHTNEIVRHGDDLIFVSGADSEVLAYNISDRDNPELIGQYINVGDSIVSWGLDVNDQYVALALVDNSVFQQPYYSDFGGIMILDWQALVGVKEKESEVLNIYPNPNNGSFRIELNDQTEIDQISIYTADGRLACRAVDLIDGRVVFNLRAGLYFINVLLQDRTFVRHMVVD